MKKSDVLAPRPKSNWANVPLERRLHFLNYEMFVPHPEMVLAIRAIEARRKRCILEGKGTAVFVEAPSGSGKSNLIRFFKAVMPNQITDERTIVPIVAFPVPSIITLKGMDTALLSALGDPKAGSGTQYDLGRRATTLLAVAETEIIFIDNIHDIPEKRRAGGIQQIGNWIRDLIDSSRRLVVLLGTKDSRVILSSNIQLLRRCPATKLISYFDVNSEIGLQRLSRFLKEIDERLPLIELSQLGDPKTARQFAYATGGLTDYIIQILSCAVSHAVTDGHERISIDDLAKSFEETFADSGRGLNPFLNEVSRVLLNEGEPLYGLFTSQTLPTASARGK